MSNTITDYHSFKKECQRRIKQLGLSEWDLDYLFKESPNENEWKAWATWDMEARQARIGLNPDAAKAVKDDAFHEVLHILLADLTELAESRFVTQREIDTALHTVIQRLITAFGRY